MLTSLTPLIYFRSLKDNNLEGSVPTHIGLLSRLAVLELQGNQLRGLLPTQFGQLVHLAILYVPLRLPNLFLINEGSLMETSFMVQYQHNWESYAWQLCTQLPHNSGFLTLS